MNANNKSEGRASDTLGPGRGKKAKVRVKISS